MSPTKRYANKQAKTRKRRRLKAHERLQQQRAQAQHSIEAIHQALKAMDFPDTLVAEIEGRLRAQQKLLGKIVALMFPTLFGCRHSHEPDISVLRAQLGFMLAFAQCPAKAIIFQ
jgi:hypothetical protein